MRHRIFPPLVLIAVLAAAVPAAAYPRPGRTQQVDLTSEGRSPRGSNGGFDPPGSNAPSISANGRFVAFASSFTDVVPGDVNGETDVFLRDLRTGRTELVSRGLAGTTAAPPLDWAVRRLPLSTNPSISANGRFVAFQSGATNLVPATDSLVQDPVRPPYRVYVFDRRTGAIRLVSVQVRSLPGLVSSLSGYADSIHPSIDATGRHVSFTSSDPDLVAHDTNGSPDVFVRDLRTGRTTRVDVTPSGGQSGGCTNPPPVVADATGVCLQGGSNDVPISSINATGRFVAFDSSASDLVAGDTNGTWDVFVRDLKKHRTERVSVTSDGSQGFDTSPEPPTGGYRGGSEIFCNRTAGTADNAMSDDGRYVVFCSMDGNLVPNDRDTDPPPFFASGLDIFVHDRVTGRTERVSVSSAGEESTTGPGGAFHHAFALPAISGDGRFVSFGWSGGTCPFGLDPCGGLLVFDRTMGSVEVASPPTNGAGSFGVFPSGQLSLDGRYVVMAADVIHPNAPADDVHIWVSDRGTALGVGGIVQSGKLSVAGAPGFAISGVVNGAGATSDVNDLLTRQGANLSSASIVYRPQFGDLFARLELKAMPSFLAANPAVVYGLDLRADGARYEVRAAKSGPSANFGLFRLEPNGLWAQVATLRGGYGTTGDEVVFALPLRDIGLSDGGRLSGIRAFTALGTFATGAASIVDTARLK